MRRTPELTCWFAVAAILVALFLPLGQTTDLGSPPDNSLIEQGAKGFLPMIPALAILGCLYLGAEYGLAIAAMGLVAIGMAVYYGTSDMLDVPVHGVSTIPLAIFGIEPEQAGPGPAIYVLGLGGLLAVAGGLMFFVEMLREGDESPTS